MVVVDAAGEAREVARYEQWSCPELAPIELTMCPDGEIGQPAGYLAKQATDYIAAHPGEGGEPVSLVIRVWRLSVEAGPTEPLDCPVFECTAVRR